MSDKTMSDKTMSDKTMSDKKLKKSTLHKCWWRWFTGNLSSMSFEWLEAFGFLNSMTPAIKELYSDDKEAQKVALRRHAAFYNTEPQIGAIINGIACGLEEERANGIDVDDEVINGIKVGLMGPLAGIGDAMVPGMLIPLLLSIAIGFSTTGSIAGPIFYIVTFLPLITFISYYLFMKGYQLGIKSVDLIVGEMAQRVREAFNLLGCIVVGGIAASYVNMVLISTIKTGNDAAIVSIDSIVNGIFPKSPALLLVLFGWWLMAKKGISALKLMFVFVLIAIAGVLLGLL